MGVLPLVWVVEAESVRARMLDFAGVRGRGTAVASCRVDNGPLAKTLEDGLNGVTLDPFRIAGLVPTTGVRGNDDFSRSGGALRGGVEGRDRDCEEDGGDSG